MLNSEGVVAVECPILMVFLLQLTAEVLFLEDREVVAEGLLMQPTQSLVALLVEIPLRILRAVVLVVAVVVQPEAMAQLQRDQFVELEEVVVGHRQQEMLGRVVRVELEQAEVVVALQLTEQIEILELAVPVATVE